MLVLSLKVALSIIQRLPLAQPLLRSTLTSLRQREGGKGGRDESKQTREHAPCWPELETARLKAIISSLILKNETLNGRNSMGKMVMILLGGSKQKQGPEMVQW